MDSEAEDSNRSKGPESSSSHKEKMMAWVDKLLSNELTVPQFEKEFYLYYVDEVPEDALSDRDSEFFGIVHEMLDYTTSDPPPEDRKYGYINYNEYKQWVADTKKRYESNEVIVPLVPE